MDCMEFRRLLDLYVDGELSGEAMAAASAHVGDCAACGRTEQELQHLRQAVKKTVRAHQAPAGLVVRVRRQTVAPRQRVLVAALVSVLFLAVAFGALRWVPGARTSLASGMEQIAFHLDRPQTLVLEGKVVCRECELYALYGSPEERDVGGHHGALKTASGRIWNFMEGEKTYALIHDASLIGKRIRIRAKVYRRAGCLEVESYALM